MPCEEYPPFCNKNVLGGGQLTRCFSNFRCENNDIWSLIKCTLCGSRAMHVCCVKKQPDQMFICPDCGYDESWHEEMRVRLRVGQTSGRAYKFQLSYLTTKFLGIALKDPTNEKITKSGWSYCLVLMHP